jgi:hypothetical protein
MGVALGFRYSVFVLIPTIILAGVSTAVSGTFVQAHARRVGGEQKGVHLREGSSAGSLARGGLFRKTKPIASHNPVRVAARVKFIDETAAAPVSRWYHGQALQRAKTLIVYRYSV